VILRGEGLTVRYPGSGRPALLEASVTLAEAELVAVVGPNGSGKTTLLRALLGSAPISAGRAIVQDRDLSTWSIRALAQVAAVVTQREDTPFPMRVRETVMLGRYARLTPAALPGEADRRAVDLSLIRADVLHLAERRTDTLSGGEWQRVRIARALAQEPRVLVLDEPTASLDLRHAMEICELLVSLCQSGLATLLVTHDLNLAARYASRIVFMREGAIVADGPTPAVLQPDLLGQVFDWPVAVVEGPDRVRQVVPLRRTGAE
jgi:iron complex transport system ATP-binding protein